MKQTVTSKYEPKSKNVTWIDMSSGSPVLKNFINGMWRPTGGSGGSGGSDYQSSGSTVKDMIEQGTNFNWAKYAIDIPSLPCFDQSKVDEALEKAVSGQEPMGVEDILSEGYTIVTLNVGRFSHSLVVRQTGDNPSASSSQGSFVFVDCEPVSVLKVEQVIMGRPNFPILPVRSFLYDVTGASEPIPVTGVKEGFPTEFAGMPCTVIGNDNFLYLAFERESAS